MKKAVVVAAVLALVSVGVSAQVGRGPAVTTASPEALALYQKAVDCVENLELSQAVPLLDEAIRKDPGFAMAYLRRAQAGGDAKTAQENIEKAVALAGKVSPAEREWILAVKGSNDRDLAATKQHMAELLKLSQADPHAWLFGGIFYRGLGDDAKSRECFERAVSIQPGFAAALNQLGYAYIRSGDFAAAETAFKKYIAARPDSPNPYDSYAEMLLNLGRYDESIAQYNAALAKDPAFTASLAGLGHNHVFKGEYVKARETYGRLYDPKTPRTKVPALFWTGTSYLHEGKTDEALKTFDELRAAAIKEGLTPRAVVSHLEQANILLEARRTADIPPHLAEAEKLLATTELAEARKNDFRRQIEGIAAMAAAQNKDRAAAQAHLDKMKALTTPDNTGGGTGGVEVVAGAIELWQGNYDAALGEFKKSDPGNVYSMFYAAEAMRLKGDRAGAAAQYKKVVAYNQNSLIYSLIRPRAVKAGGS